MSPFLLAVFSSISQILRLSAKPFSSMLSFDLPEIIRKSDFLMFSWGSKVKTLGKWLKFLNNTLHSVELYKFRSYLPRLNAVGLVPNKYLLVKSRQEKHYKVNNKVTTITWCTSFWCTSFFIVNVGHMSHFFLVFLFLTVL